VRSQQSGAIVLCQFCSHQPHAQLLPRLLDSVPPEDTVLVMYSCVQFTAFMLTLRGRRCVIAETSDIVIEWRAEAELRTTIATVVMLVHV
jgi:hypothetical protein